MITILTGVMGGIPDVEAAPLDVGTAKQVFIDRRFIESSRGVELVVNRPRITREKLLAPEHPWESGWIGGYLSVIQEGDRIRMWYDSTERQAIVTRNAMQGVGYAYSTDGGATWTKPKLGVIEYQGSHENNLVLTGVHGIHVFCNRPDAPPEEKYVLFAGEPNRAFVSPDGLHWKTWGKTPFLNMAGHRGLDSQNVMFWDTRIGKYAAYPRIKLRKMGELLRMVGRSESHTLGGFPDPVVVFQPDDEDPPDMDFYTSAAIQYPYAADAYYMFPSAYHHWPSPPHPKNDGPVDIQFAAGRDGLHWIRPDRRPLIRCGLEGDWDSGCLYAGYGLSRHGDELSLYYTACDVTHGAYQKRGYLGGVITRAIYRLDGFMSVDAGYHGGQFTTPPLVFSGDRLEINYDGSAGGWARVELLDGGGRPIPGFTERQADKINGNAVAKQVTWSGNGNLAPLKSNPIRLRFIMRNCKLYAFQFPAPCKK